MIPVLLSLAIGILVIVLLWCIAMFGAMHQEGVFGTIGYVIAGIIDLPVIYLYGADPRTPPSPLVSIAIYLSEALIVGLFVYLIFFARK